MDVIEKLSVRFTKEIVPLITYEVEIAYIISMVLLSVKSAERDWHKKYVFYSYLRALLYVKGSDIILALCMGESPIKEISCNHGLLLVALIWWLALFVPFDVFNRVLNFELGDVKPFMLLLGLMTTVRQVIAVEKGVKKSLKLYPGSYIAVFVGTLAGNGSLVVASVFGDFAKAISNYKMTTVAFVSALEFTLTAILCPKAIAAPVVFACLVVFMLVLELLSAFDQKVYLFETIYEIVRRVVVTCDLFDN